MRSLVAIASAILFGISASACSDGSPEARAPHIVFDDVVVTPTRGAVPTNAGYMVIRNTGASSDQLTGASSPDARTVDLHANLVQDGVVRMMAVTQPLTIPAGGELALRSGGYHLMIVDPSRRLAIGDRFPLILEFKRSGPIRVDATVAELLVGRGDGARRSTDHHAHH